MSSSVGWTQDDYLAFQELVIKANAFNLQAAETMIGQHIMNRIEQRQAEIMRRVWYGGG